MIKFLFQNQSSLLCFSTTAIDTSSGTGIIGTHGGQVYVWELATGSKLETLHDLEGKFLIDTSLYQ